MVDVWETAQGLPQGTVTAITQTRDGYLWVGTPSGLACFDGLRFQAFDTLNTPGLRSSHITALLADPDGGLWIGTADGGATRLFQGRFQSFSTAEGLLDNAVRALGGNERTGVWIGTAKGANVWMDGALGLPAADGIVPEGPVNAICEAADSAHWMLGPGGLYEVVGRQVKLAARQESLGRGVDGMARGQNGQPWLFGNALSKVSAVDRSIAVQAVALAGGDRVTAVCERADGAVWLGTGMGEIRRMGREPARNPPGEDRVVRPAIRCLFEDRELNLWVGRENGGLLRIKPRKVRVYSTHDGLPGERITSLCPDGEGGFWVGCHAAGIGHWRSGEFTTAAKIPLPEHCTVWSLLRTRDGSLWIGTENDGLLEWKDGRLAGFPGPGGSTVLSMEETADGSLWVGTRDGALWRWKRGERVPVPGPALDGKAVGVLASDRRGGLWAGTDGGGLYHLTETIGARFTRADGLGSDRVRSLLVADAGTLWVGTTGGVTRIKNGRVRNFDSRHGMWDNTISQILEDRMGPVGNGQLWFGSNRGVFRIGMTSFDDLLAGKINRLEPVAYGRSEGMDSLECSGGFSPAGLFQAAAENPGTLSAVLWFPTLRGLARFELFPLTGRVRGISGDHIAFTKAVLHLGPDDTRLDLGDVVAGGNGFGTGRAAGIHVLDGNLSNTAATHAYGDGAKAPAERYHRTKLPLVDGVFIPDGGVVPGRETVISSTGLKAEFPPTTGEAWGLLKSGWQVAGVDHFNPSEMRELGAPMVWTSGNMGVTFDLAAVRRTTGKSITRFSAQVCNLHIGPGSFHVLLDGRVAAKRSGLVHDYGRYQRGIVPLDIPVPEDARFLTLVSTDDKDEPGALNRQPPVVTIEEVLADGAPRQSSAEIGAGVAPGALHPVLTALEIAPGVRRLDFRYAAPNLTAPEKVRFRYRLEPLETGWVEAADRRAATYAQLPPGTYRFLVTACNNDAVWSPVGAAVTVTLRPHFWQTRWFAPLWIGSLALLIAGITAAALRIRHRRQVRLLEQTRAIAVERTRIARDIHDDLGAGLTHVALLTDLVRNELTNPESAKSHLDEVFTVARRLARGVDEIVWAINPKNDALELSLNYITKAAQDFLRAAGIACRLDWPESLPPGTLSSAQRHHLYLVVREGLNNVVKHAAATEVGIRWAATATGVTVEVSDNGRGFTPPPPGAPATRHGLGGMAGRMTDAGGTFEITNRPGAGTLIRLWLPLQRSGFDSRA